MKEFIIQVESISTRQQIKLIKACKALCNEYDGEFHLKTVDKNYKPGALKIVNTNKDKKLFWDIRKP